MYIVKTSKLFQATKKCPIEVIILSVFRCCTLLTFPSPVIQPGVMLCPAKQLGIKRYQKHCLQRGVYQGFRGSRSLLAYLTTTNTFITQHDEQYHRQTEKWDLNVGRKCSIIFHTTKAKSFQVFTRRSKMKKSTMRIITEIDPPLQAMTC